MADEDNEQNSVHEEEIEDDEDWTEPVELDGLEDGHSTFIVGGFSKHADVASAVAAVKSQDDRILVLAGEYAKDVSLDSTANLGLKIAGDANAAAADVVFKGLLDVQFTTPEDKGDDGAAVDDDGEPIAPTAPPAPLSISHMTFLHGGVFTECTDADVSDVVFGAAISSADAADAVPRTVRCHGLSTVRFSECTVYGMGRSAVYCYPHARASFDKCQITGSKKPVAPLTAAEVKLRKKKGLPVVDGPPAPSVPAACECESGVQADNGASTFKECTVKFFDIGVVCSDVCKGLQFNECHVSEVTTVGVLLGANASPALRDTVVKLCGRETLVVGDAAHPTLRDNIFVGDVRLKPSAIGTGICDNTIALSGKLIDEQGVFGVKGFTVVPTDPSLKPKKKVVEEDEE